MLSSQHLDADLRPIQTANPFLIPQSSKNSRLGSTQTRPSNPNNASYEFEPPASVRVALWDNTPISATIYSSISTHIPMKINLQKPAFDSYLSLVKNQFTNTIHNSDITNSSKSILAPPAFVGYFIGQIVTSRPIVQELSELKKTESYSDMSRGKEDKIVKSLVLDRFDPGKRVKGLKEDIKSNGYSDRVPTITLDGDIVVKAFISKMNGDKSKETSHAVTSQSSNSESTPFSTTIIFNHEDDKSQIHSSCHLLASPYSFEYNLIHPLRIVPTTLSTRLLISSSNNLQGDEEEEYEMGYVTINRARQAFLIASTDPRRKTVPLVGIWIQGPQDLKELKVYTDCTRYIRNQELCKLKSIDQSFLVVLMPLKSSGARRNAKFYECRFQEPSQEYLSYDDAQNISIDDSKRSISLSCQWRLKENNMKDKVETPRESASSKAQGRSEVISPPTETSESIFSKLHSADITHTSPNQQFLNTDAKGDLHSSCQSSGKSTTEQSTSPLKAVKILTNDKSQSAAALIPENSPKPPAQPVGTTSGQNTQSNLLPSFPLPTISSATPVHSDSAHYVYLQQQQMFMNMMIQQMEMLKNQVMLQTCKDASLQSQSSSVSSRSSNVSVSTAATETQQKLTRQTSKNIIMKEIGTNTTFVDSSTWLSMSKMVTSIGTNTTFKEATASPMMSHATQSKQLKDTFTSTAITIEPTISDLETLATKDINLHQPFNNELTLPPTDDGNNYIPFMYGPASIHSNSPLPLVDRTPLSPSPAHPSQEIPNRSTIIDDDGGHEDQELTYEELQPHDSLSMIYEHNDLDNNGQKVKSPRTHDQQQNKEEDSNQNMAELLDKVSRILEPNEVDEIRGECSGFGENQCQTPKPKEHGSLEDKNGVNMIAKAVKHSDMKFIIMESATAGQSQRNSEFRGNNETIVAKVKEVVGSSVAQVPIANAELKKVATTPKSNSMKGKVTEVQTNETSCNNTINDLSALLSSELTLDPITLKYLTQIWDAKNANPSQLTNNLGINDLSKTIYTSTPNTSIDYHESPCNTEQIRSNRKSGKAEKDGLSVNTSNIHEGFSLASLEFLKKHDLLNK